MSRKKGRAGARVSVEKRDEKTRRVRFETHIPKIRRSHRASDPREQRRGQQRDQALRNRTRGRCLKGRERGGSESEKAIEAEVERAGGLTLDGSRDGLSSVGNPDGLATGRRRVGRTVGSHIGGVESDGLKKRRRKKSQPPVFFWFVRKREERKRRKLNSRTPSSGEELHTIRVRQRCRSR